MISRIRKPLARLTGIIAVPDHAENDKRVPARSRVTWLLPFLGMLLVVLALVSLTQVSAAANAPQSIAAISQKGTLVLNGDNRIISAVIDEAGGFAYFGTDTTPGTVIKVRLSDFSRVDTLTLKEGEDKLTSAVIDPGNGFAYFGTNTSPGIVVKVRLSDFKRVGALSLPDLISGEAAINKLSSAVIDPGSGFAYFGTAERTVMAV